MVIAPAEHHSIEVTDVVRAAAIGLIAGLAASLAMDGFQAGVGALSSSEGDTEPATDRAANGIVRAATRHNLSASAKPIGGHLVHYALGAGLGALYGAAAAYRRDITAGYGTGFGAGVAVVLDNAVVPAAKLGDPPWRTSPSKHVYSLASHFVFGAVLEFIRLRLNTLVPGERPVLRTLVGR